MKLNTKSIIVIVAVLLLLVLGTYFLSSPRRQEPMPPQETMNPYGAFGSPGGGMPDMNKLMEDPANIVKLMTQNGMDMRLTDYISQAKFQLVGATNTSLHCILTFPDNLTIEETITLTPNLRYAPNPADLKKTEQSGIQVLNPTLSLKKTGPGQALCTLHYFVLQNSLPADFQQWIQKISATSQYSGAAFFSLMPSAWAQEGGSGEGGSLSGTMAELAQTMEVKGLELLEHEDAAHALEILGTLKEMFDVYGKMQGWLEEIGELQDCAENPTDPLTMKASRNPEYQKEVLDPLNDAAWDVRSTEIPLLANFTMSTVAKALGKELPGLGVAISPIIQSNDAAIDEITENRIREIQKYVVPCDKAPMTPGDLRPMEGVVRYTYNSKPPHELPGVQDTRNAEGKFALNIVGGGGLAGEGIADYTHEYVALSINSTPGCQGVADSMKAKGKVKITAGGGGTSLGGVIELRFQGDLPVEEAHLVSEGDHCREQTKSYTSSFGAVCRFQNVDMVHGGTFSTYAEGSEGYGTCTMELSRK